MISAPALCPCTSLGSSPQISVMTRAPLRHVAPKLYIWLGHCSVFGSGMKLPSGAEQQTLVGNLGISSPKAVAFL